MSVLSQLFQHKLVAILRGLDPEKVFPVVKALYEGGIRAVEITLNSKDALLAIEQLTSKQIPGLLIGAGTVLDAESAGKAIAAGAEFIISPNTDEATIGFTKNKNKISIPGAYTATEIVRAFQFGGDIIKVFPATSPGYIRELRGPLAHIPMMPTGGINADNILEYQQAGGMLFGLGTALVNAKHEITDSYLEGLTVNARELLNKIVNN